MPASHRVPLSRRSAGHSLRRRQPGRSGRARVYDLKQLGRLRWMAASRCEAGRLWTPTERLRRDLGAFAPSPHRQKRGFSGRAPVL